MTTPAEGTGKPGGKLAAAAGGKRNLLIIAAAGTALFAVLMSRRNGGGGGGSDQQMMGYDSTPYDQYNDLQDQLEDLQRQLDNGSVTPGKATMPAPIPSAPKPTPTPAGPKAKPKPVKLPAKTTAGKTVVIKRGDTLSGIAKKAGISMSRLKQLNPTFWKNPKYDHGNKIWAGGKVRVS